MLCGGSGLFAIAVRAERMGGRVDAAFAVAGAGSAGRGCGQGDLSAQGVGACGGRCGTCWGLLSASSRRLSWLGPPVLIGSGLMKLARVGS